MRHQPAGRGTALAVALSAALLAGCGSGAQPEKDGPGDYTAKKDICAVLPLAGLKHPLGELYGTADASDGNDGGAPSARCTQSFDGAEGTPFQMTVVTVHAIYLPTVELARKLYTFDHDENEPKSAIGGSVADVKGVGRQAFSFRNTAGDAKGPIEELVVRDSNLELNLTVGVGYRDAPDDASAAAVTKAMQDFVRDAMGALRG